MEESEKFKLLKKQLQQLTVLSSNAIDLQLKSLVSVMHPSEENSNAYVKANSSFFDSVDEMRKLIVEGYDLC